jgi:Zn-finger nucleic acid-binding protein
METLGLINTYTCPTCGWRAVTVNRADGVTPMFIRCEGVKCDRNDLPGATSAMYRVPQTLAPTHEWYRPDDAELIEKPWARRHVSMGGLLLRSIAP